MERDFSDRTVLVTGAAGNLGAAVAAEFSQRCANQVDMDLKGEALAKAYGTWAQTVAAPVDLLEQAQVDTAVERVVARFGRIDVLVNLAGGFRMGEPVHAMAESTWNFMLDLNVRSLLHAVPAVVPHMLAGGGGKIVNVGAFAAQRGAAQMGAYIASKSAVIRLTESMAAALREQNVNVNCVLPTIIDTPQNRAAMPNADPAKWVAPGDLAKVIAFLASDAARAVHGAALPVSGLS